MATTKKNGAKAPGNRFKYSEAEIDELVNWFNGKRLPQSMRLDGGTFIPDVGKTVMLLSAIVTHKQSPAFESTASQLFKIRQEVQRFIDGETVEGSQEQTNQTK